MTTQALLDEAIAARHALLVGKARVSFSVNIGGVDRRVEYTQANLADLDNYIAELRRTISGRARTRNRIRYMVPL